MPTLDERQRQQAQRIAQASADAMYERDRAARAFGIALEEVGPGYARLSMSVRHDMVNGHDICHGGLIFSLADTAFAYACNSYNRITVAAQCAIAFTAPARLADQLTAECREQYANGRSGIYDVRVTRQGDELVALFRGNARTLTGEVAPGIQVEQP